MKNKIKSFVRSHCLKLTLLPLTENRVKLMAGFLQCNQLEEFVYNRPTSFTVEKWESIDNITWNKVEEIIYHEVVWHGHVNHSDSVEKSACHGNIDFTYKHQNKNHEFNNLSVIIKEGASPWIGEFIDNTKNSLNKE